MDEMEYLQAGFDPSTLTMPKLRNILMTHNIQYPSSAKKNDLVEIFNTDLKPKSKKLLAARDRVRRTSEGIMNMPSRNEPTTEDESSIPPPSIAPTPRSRKSKKSARNSSDENSEGTVTKSSTRKSGGRKSRQSDTENDADIARTPSTKSGKSGATRKVKEEEPEETPVRPPLPESAFSDENPFQSGSSPPPGEEPRRKSAGAVSGKKKNSETRRKTEGSSRTSDATSSRSLEFPISKAKRVKQEVPEELQPGEEFTPEEQTELETEAATNPESRALTRRDQQHSAVRVPKSVPWVVLSSLLVGFATWFRQEKLAVGYCGLSRTTESQWPVQVPEWADFAQPTCESCPQHATCFENLEAKCDPGFILVPHPLAAGGLVPLPPTCEPDGEKARKVKAVADRAVETLRQRKADAECGTSTEDDTGKPVSSEIAVDDLKKEVGKNRRRNMGEAEFEELWKGAIGEIVGRDEVVTSGDGPSRLLSSTSFARLSLACALRRSASLAMARYRRAISLIVLVILSAAYARNTIRTRQADNSRIPSLVSTVLDRLATQAAIHTRDGDDEEPWISAGQLRDDILRDIFSDSRRERVWSRVRDIVEKNANVRASVRESRAGDVSRVWEWIGSTGFFLDDPYSDEGTGGGRRRKSGSSGGKRVSFGALEDGSGAGDTSLLTGTGENGNGYLSTPGGTEMVQKRTWDEGRPIY